jgi:PAS domain S-box-containing protein
MNLADILILNVDDNDGARYAKTRMLRVAGFHVIEAANGADALSLVTQRKPSLVLLDVKLPDMSGIDVCRQIKANPESSMVLVLQTSAHLTGSSDKIRGLEGGADNYLAAPIDADELIANVTALLRLQQAQAELRAERDKGQYIFNTMTEGFGLIAPDWTVQQINAEGLRLGNRTAEQVIGKNHWEIWPEAKGFELEALYRRVVETKLPGSLECRNAFSNTENVWLEVRAYPAMDGGLATFFRDISDRKEAEEKLKEADRRKDEFLAMLAHELRNPLAPISAAAELLRITELPPEHVRNTSDIISRQVDHMTGLINDLLDVSRVTTGFVVIAKSEVDIKKVMSEAFEQVRPLIESRHHQFSLQMGGDSFVVAGDHKRLVQVLANLLNNAAKYTPEGGQILVQLDASESAIKLSVSDNGIGMSPELLPRLFQPFSQAKRTSDRAQGGLGLGLTLVKRLVELHGGTVIPESKGENAGSTFTIMLPRLLSKNPEQFALLKSPQQAAPLPSKAIHLLIVDDNVDAAHMLGMYLQAKNYHVTVEHDSYSALELATHGKFDAYLLDIGLPGMDGNELARRLRELPQAKDARMIAITGYGRKFDKESSMEAGFDEYVVKPANPMNLIGLLADLHKL